MIEILDNAQLEREAPQYHALARRIVATQPTQINLIERVLQGIDGKDYPILDRLAGYVERLLAPDIDQGITDYLWMCDRMLRAEIQARRSKGGVNASFQEVLKGIYAQDKDHMARYMRGLLVSQAVWRQHIGPLLCFMNDFLPNLKDGDTYLEVGPGHGLWMATAAAMGPSLRFHGWDVHPESIAQTEKALRRIGFVDKPRLVLQDICNSPPVKNRFEAIVMSQVLEIVQSPEGALQNISETLTDNGLLFINAPVRAAALDHIRRWSDKEELISIVKAAGLDIILTKHFGSRSVEIKDTEGFSLVLVARPKRARK